MRLIGAIPLGVARSGDQKISEIDERGRVGASSLPPPPLKKKLGHCLIRYCKPLLEFVGDFQKKKKGKEKTKIERESRVEF